MRALLPITLVLLMGLVATGCWGGEQESDSPSHGSNVTIYEGDKITLEVFPLPDGTVCAASRTNYSGAGDQGGLDCNWTKDK